jgi:hypothetical protein
METQFVVIFFFPKKENKMKEINDRLPVVKVVSGSNVHKT